MDTCSYLDPQCGADRMAQLGAIGQQHGASLLSRAISRVRCPDPGWLFDGTSTGATTSAKLACSKIAWIGSSSLADFGQSNGLWARTYEAPDTIYAAKSSDRTAYLELAAIHWATPFAGSGSFLRKFQFQGWR